MDIELVQKCLTISKVSDCLWAGSQVKKIAQQLGFQNKQIWELATVTSELATNMVKYAGSGCIIIRSLDSPAPGVEIIADDQGPGIDCANTALLDGFSEGSLIKDKRFINSRRGLGSGLGSVKRFMDELHIETKQEGGTRIVTRKWRTQYAHCHEQNSVGPR
ncbi:ATP-binding protein [bacterium]|nr:ATP-binding protein [bacterium]